jgi:prepilin-type N-terminal cleavage/methylation domain-containing protein
MFGLERAMYYLSNTRQGSSECRRSFGRKGSKYMLNTYRQLKRRRDVGEISGFTLIELLIVIVVLGILAAVVIFALGGITGKSALSACQADGATVATAISAYNAQNPGGAPTEADLTQSVGGTQYLSSWPTNGTYYTFSIDGAGVLSLTSPEKVAGLAYDGPSACTLNDNTLGAGKGANVGG